MGKAYTEDNLRDWLRGWVQALNTADNSTDSYILDLVSCVMWQLCEPNEEADAAFAYLNGERTRRQLAAESARRKAAKEQTSGR